MAISYKDDHGADLMDFGIIDWFGSGGNGGGSGGTGGALAGGGAGGAIGSAAALLIAIGKEKWEKLFGGMDENYPLYIPKPEDIPSGPPANDKPGKGDGTIIDPIPDNPILPEQIIPDNPKLDIPSGPPANDKPGIGDGTIINPIPGENVIPDNPTVDVPKVEVEDVPKVEVEDVPKVENVETPPLTQGEEDMEDNTFANIENAITTFDPLKWAEDQQTKIWAREDAIREQTRFDQQHAYQYAIDDMQRAGINPNLMGSINPAASGGGITNATPADTALAQKQMEKDMELLKQSIDLAFKEDQNQKDRIWSLIEKVLGAGAMLGSAAIR